MPIYCGNNRQNSKLISGELDIGTRSQCLKKGVGVGINQPIDPDYLDNYEKEKEDPDSDADEESPITDDTLDVGGNYGEKPQGGEGGEYDDF